MTEIEHILRSAKELIRSPRYWTQGKRKRERLLRPTQYCLLGAVSEAAGTHYSADGKLRWRVLQTLAPHIDHSVEWFNDTGTFEEVHQALDAAIFDTMFEEVIRTERKSVRNRLRVHTHAGSNPVTSVGK